MAMHNPFANPEIAAGYEAWYNTSGRQADHQEKALLKRLLHCFPLARFILEVGSGTGHFTHWLGTQGFQTIGLEVPFPMLKEAKHLKSSVCLQGREKSKFNVMRLPRQRLARSWHSWKRWKSCQIGTIVRKEEKGE